MEQSLIKVERNNGDDEKEISLIDMIRVMLKHKKMIIITAIVFTLLSVVLAFSLQKVYHSEVTFMSDGGGKSNSLAGLIDSPLASLAGIGGATGSIDYTLILKSRTFQETVIEKMELEKLYIKDNNIDMTKIEEKDKPTIQKILKWLDGSIEISRDSKSGVFTIGVNYKEPETAAKIANGFYNELEIYLKDKILTKSKRTRKYLEKQIEAVMAKIAVQEEEAKSLERKYKSPSVVNEAQAMGEMIGKLKTNIMELNARLDVAKDFAGTENLEYRKTKRELEVYTEQLKALEQGNKRDDVNLIPMKDIPDIKIRMQRLQREVEGTAQIYKLLIAQYEQAKLEELKDEVLITILDDAIPAERPVKPNKKLIVLIGMVLGVFVGIYGAFMIEFAKGIDWKKIMGK